MRRTTRAAAAAFALLGGCGLFGDDEPEPPPPVCARIDLPARALAGVMLRAPEGAGALEVLPVEGRATRRGAVRRLETGDRTLRIRARDEDGGFAGWFGERGTPIAGLADGEAVAARRLAYREDGLHFVARAVYGRPTQARRIPTAGQARYAGPVRLERVAADGSTAVLAGRAEIAVGFGSGRVEARLTGLAGTAAAEAAAAPLPPVAALVPEAVAALLPEGGGEAAAIAAEAIALLGQGEAADAVLAAAPGPEALAELEWTRLGLCGARIGSTGQGAFRARDAHGRPVPLVGAALFDGTLYGDEGALPGEVAGVLVIQGDGGALSGVFLARRLGAE